MNRAIIHHYVPQWYQKRFLLNGETELTVRDLNPFVNANGKKYKINEFQKKGTKKIFQLKDLYSIYHNGEYSDIIESLLFGPIDRNASNAISELVNGNWNEFHDKINSLLDFICIQKYRTPRGVSFLEKEYPKLSHDEIIGHLIQTKNSFKAMISESFWEIVQAPNHNFILSDCPTTYYNRKIYPGHSENRYPNFPDFKRIGTQIIFPLDNSYCLIISHKDLLRGSILDSMRFRVNAREFGDSLFFYGDLIQRERRLLEKYEVDNINQIIIESATKYIASPNKDDLLHKKRPDWQKVGLCLIPYGKHEVILGANGRILVGGPSNELFYAQDEYGRNQYSNPKWSGR